MKWMIIIGIVTLIVVLLAMVDVTCKRAARKHIAGRPRRSTLEFGQQFYPDRASVAAEVRDILAKYIPVDLSQLEPSDQPVRDLHMDDLDSMATLEFVIALEEHFGITIEDPDAEQMRTVDDVVRYVISKVDQKRTNNNGVQATGYPRA